MATLADDIRPQTGTNNVGRIAQVIGAVVDVHFDNHHSATPGLAALSSPFQRLG